MNDDHDPSAKRIIAISLGVSIAAVCAFLAWGAFALLTMMMNPALSEADYWAAVRDRAASEPTLAGAVVVFGLGAVVSVGLMVRAVVWPRDSK